MQMTATQRAAYNGRLAELEARYRCGEWTLDQLNAAVVELDAEFADRADYEREARREREMGL